ncbi:FadR/GntR family transcriptional regulator [Algihabitans albus]|uniref:FadR/GntR family transcriptional regulator n=1 Tax=Algihabitans albus TaxID=2164067 RepID=UPI000E5D955C|nr:FadR/GntR family transcriptional regulator [Algihabitans albus]
MRPRATPALAADPRFQEIPRERVSDRVAQELLRLIATGELAPGERLPGERQLAEMMSVSRVSVRAALQQLKARGVVRAVQGGGTRVVAAVDELESSLATLVRVNPSNLRDLMELRASLEVWAARRAAERADDARKAEIARRLAVMRDPDRPSRHKAEDDLNFHLAIAKASGSAVYLHLMSVLSDILEDMFSYHRYALYVRPEDDRLFLEDHARIAEAIASGDGGQAAEAMATHLEHVKARYREEDMARDPALAASRA